MKNTGKLPGFPMASDLQQMWRKLHGVMLVQVPLMMQRLAFEPITGKLRPFKQTSAALNTPMPHCMTLEIAVGFIISALEERGS